MVPVGVGIGVGVVGKMYFWALNDLAAQSQSNNLGRYLKVRTTLLKLGAVPDKQLID